MSFLNQYAKESLKYGPSIRKGSQTGTTAMQDMGDTSPFEDAKGFVGKTPVSKDTLYKQLAEKAGVDPEQIDIVSMAGTPKNALHYGYISGLAKADGKSYKFAFYYKKDGTIDEPLSTFEELGK